jgi:hypothetical protein
VVSWIGLACAGLALLAGCAAPKPPQASNLEVGPALVMLLDGLAAAQLHQASAGRMPGLLISEASVQLSLTVKDTDKQSLVIAMPGAAGSPGFTFTPFDRSREDVAANSITVKFSGLINTSLKDSMLEAVKDAVKLKDGEAPEAAVARLKRTLEALQGVAPGLFKTAPEK